MTDWALLRWLRQRDRDLAALRRAGRTALVMPAMFAIGDEVIGNPAVATFAAFGSFAMLLLVDFAGPMRSRLTAQAGLAIVCAVFICVATLVSRSAWLAAVSMGLVAFGVLFAGVVSSVLAGATTALLLAFILPVSLPGRVSSIPDRLAGWGMASGAALVAIALLWPAPVRNPLRAAAIAACRAIAARLRSDVAYVLGDRSPADEAEHEAAIEQGNAAVEDLHSAFFATPYRPTGLSTAARTVVRLVDELKWLDAIVVQGAPHPDGATVDRRACGVKSAAAEALERSADLLHDPMGERHALQAAVASLRERTTELERSAMLSLPVPSDVISSLDPSFRGQELSFVVTQIANNVDLTAAAEQRSWPDQLMGRPPEGVAGRLAAGQERAGSHAQRHSLWLQNSVRGAVGLGLAALVANLSGVQHSFWVVLGTLSVLRSSALSTGQDLVRALLGTMAGFLVGAVLVSLIGTNTTVLWALLPVAVLLAGLAPATVSFAAGQAAFTLTLLILFNILVPEGWQIGLVRLEDVALGGAVSLVVGLLFWPRGASAALGVALAEAYRSCATYLSRAVEFGMGRCDSAPGSSSDPPTREAMEAAAASRRLDDTFRSYLADRGEKPVPLSDVTGLVMGVAGLRLTGDAVLDLWQGAEPADGDRTTARGELRASSDRVSHWYDAFAAGLVGRSALPEPLTHDELADSRLVAAVTRDLLGEDGQATATAVRMVWTGEHLDAARRLQDTLTEPARELAGQPQPRALSPSPR